MVASKSLKKINKRKKNISLKKRLSAISLKRISNSVVKSRNTVKSQYKLSLNKNFSYRFMNTSELRVCNLRKAFRNEEKLKYKLDKCYDYDDPKVQNYLTDRLKSEFTIEHVSNVIAPKQIDGNCWFNAMFMMFFISDRGRIFFRHLRQLMIEGRTDNTNISDVRLKNAFALLNFIVECCINGNKLAKSLNTNKIIKQIHELTKEKGIRTPNIGEAGNPIHYYHKLENYLVKEALPNSSERSNPIKYYNSLINYLGNRELKLITLNSYTWKSELNTYINNPPHVIIIETKPRISNQIVKKNLRFSLGNYVYELDSASIIDNGKEHFCSLVTCNGIQFAFDGYSKSRLVPFEWKPLINENVDWDFKDYIYEFETETIWNFTIGYSCLCYYRIV